MPVNPKSIASSDAAIGILIRFTNLKISFCFSFSGSTLTELERFNADPIAAVNRVGLNDIDSRSLSFGAIAIFLIGFRI